MTQKYTQLFPVKVLYGESSIDECDTILANPNLMHQYTQADAVRRALGKVQYTPSDDVVNATLEKCFEALGVMLHH